MDEPLTEIIAHSLMPSVMISAGAVILQGIWTEHRSVSEQTRAVWRRLREPPPAAERTEGGPPPSETAADLVDQLAFLKRRLRLNVAALTAVYAALASFLFITLSLAAGGPQTPQKLLRIVFVAGVALMFVAVTVVIWEVRLAGRSLKAEISMHRAFAEHS